MLRRQDPACMVSQRDDRMSTAPIQIVADLHTHTTCSDGLLSPMELVVKAEQRGFQALAITDHDNLDAYRLLRKQGYNGPVKVISAVEISCYDFGREVHILAYNVDVDDPSVQQYESFYRGDRARRAEEMVENLHRARAPISIQEVVDEAAGAPIGRPHVASVLVRRGFVSSIQAAFDVYLDQGKPGYAAKTPFPIAKAVEMIHQAGGVLSVAHPGRYFTDPTLFLPLLDTGIDGIEVYHPSHWHVTREFYRVLCQQHGLLITGGSDFHGSREYDEANFGVFGVTPQALEQFESKISRQSSGRAN
ncbi:MAG: PHP domain-containing protein [Candidatus Kapabacteria bacterium]|nr:PHP domain-containing protein [Candidatus Kapabacteria bacterium]